MCAIMEEIFQTNDLVGTDNNCVLTASTDNEGAGALSGDLITNYVVQVRCVVQTLALFVKDVFTDGKVWQKYPKNFNDVATYLIQHHKAGQQVFETQLYSGLSNYRIQKKLKVTFLHAAIRVSVP